jgi:hypothetical protein
VGIRLRTPLDSDPELESLDHTAGADPHRNVDCW